MTEDNTSDNHGKTFKDQVLQLGHIFHFQKIPVPWRRAIVAGLGLFTPVILGILIGHPLWGMMASTGGFTAIYATDGPPKVVAAKLCLVVIGLMISVALGTLSASSPWSIAIVSAVVAGSAAFICGAFQVLPPGPFFFIMACAVSSALPIDPGAAGTRALFSLGGGTIAWIIGMAGCLWSHQLKKRKFQGNTQFETGNLQNIASMSMKNYGRIRAAFRRDSIVGPASVRIAIGVFAATLLAYALGNERPYWVPVACSAVLIGKHVMATIHRAIQRAIGTCIGIFIAGAIFSFHPSYVVLAVLLLVLQILVELIVGRNYVIAAIFITPLGLIVAETANTGLSPAELIHARLTDNLLGVSVGLAAGLLLWRRSGSKRLRLAVAQSIRSAGHLLLAIIVKESNQSVVHSQLSEMSASIKQMGIIFETAQNEFPHKVQLVDELRPVILATRKVGETLKQSVGENDQLNSLHDFQDEIKEWFESVAKSVEQGSVSAGDMPNPLFDRSLRVGPPIINLRESLFKQ